MTQRLAAQHRSVNARYRNARRAWCHIDTESVSVDCSISTLFSRAILNAQEWDQKCAIVTLGLLGRGCAVYAALC